MTFPQTETERPRTLAADVFLRLRSEIVSCRIDPGAPLRFEALKEKFGASFSTLREALTALVADGLVVSEGQRGFRVSPASRSDLVDLTHSRVLIERELLKLAIENGNDEWKVVTTAALHRLSILEQRHPGRFYLQGDYRVAHQHFHEALVSASGSTILLGIRANLYARAERYRSLSALYRKHKRNKMDEHKAILDAAIARKTEKAQDLIERHIRATTSNVLENAGELLT